MGREARRRHEQLKAKILDEIADWTRPATAEEQHVAAEIAKLPTVMVRREPAERLAWARMKSGECHTNCLWYEENDPTRSFKAVAGWWKQPYGVYTFHSVIRNGNDYVCITPAPGPNEFEFAPDPEITRVEEESGSGSFRRLGNEVPKIRAKRSRADDQGWYDHQRAHPRWHGPGEGR
jgi:hypothetical protein